MRIFFLLLCLFHYSVFSDFDPDAVLSGGDDPSLFQHVNVISGQLTLQMEDTVLQGAHPLSIGRSYTSGEAFQKTRWAGITSWMHRRRWIVQGGWGFLPHINLMVRSPDPEREPPFKRAKFELAEPNGMMISYRYSHKEAIDDHTAYYYYKPKKLRGGNTSLLGARQDPTNNVLRVRLNKRRYTEYQVDVFLANGGVRRYRKLGKQPEFEGEGYFYYYKLVREDLPSGRFLDFHYDSKDKLLRIEVKNPSGTKVHSWVKFDIIKDTRPFAFKITTSDNQSITYQAMEYHGLEYLERVKGKRVREVGAPSTQHEWSSKKEEYFGYGEVGTEFGCRVREVQFSEALQARIEYYECSEWSRNRTEDFYKKNPSADKVRAILVPDGFHMRQIAEFYYHPGYTDVCDTERVLTRYHHHDNKIVKIESFTKEGSLYSTLHFFWRHSRLIGKALCDGSGKPIFSKTFRYDEKGNVLEEALWGNITGSVDPEGFVLEKDGSIRGGEAKRKRYGYESDTNLLMEEEEEGGLSYLYRYKPGTDLPIVKLTKKEGRILQREFLSYDADNFLVEEIIDDGIGSASSDLEGMTQGRVRRYEVDGKGLVTSRSEFYRDRYSGEEVLLERRVYGYGEGNLRTTEAIYDAKNALRYTLKTEYDHRGRVTSRSLPSGGENTYDYDSWDRVSSSHEEGFPNISYTYDNLGRPICSQEVYGVGRIKSTYNTYDSRGRLIERTDFLGNKTYQDYDTFGRCVTTRFPPVRDENGEEYVPSVAFAYDVAGNLISHTNPKGETTRTEYNVLQQPIRIEYPDGSVLRHFYNMLGMLAQTIEPDGTTTFYEYDSFLRETSKLIFSPSGALLAEERNTYTTYVITSRLERGLLTTFEYDGAGKKIKQTAEDRETFYEYDDLGFLEKTTFGDTVTVEKHDVSGNVVEKWEERGSEITNRMYLHYGTQGLLEKAERITSQGIATDHFLYDDEGHLCEHKDPQGASTYFLYSIVKGDLGRSVLRKSTVNPMGDRVSEIHDANGRVVRKENKDRKGKIVGLQEFFYDRAGNRARRVVTVYDDHTPIKTITYLARHDAMGRVIEEIEAGKKVLSRSYDEAGRERSRTLPSGIVLSFSYDGLGRLLSLQSSDHTVDYRYEYASGPDPVTAYDVLRGITIGREYNAFGQTLSETSPVHTYAWTYDRTGRCEAFSLPDRSSITKEYRNGNLYTVTRRDPSGFALYTHTYTKFDVNNKVCEEVLPENIGKITTAHDLLERPSRQSSLWNDYQTTYDAGGRLTEIRSSLFGEKRISYDPLGQITQDGNVFYEFNSIGNSKDYEINDCNEVLSGKGGRFSYDPDGNLIRRSLPDKEVSYSYDALGRLTGIFDALKEIRYTYDPFSRLYSKQTINCEGGEETVFFLYEGDVEIGTFDLSGDIRELKVSGLGILGEIGSAVAIELTGKVYVPLHDLQGNCIGLIDSSGVLVESYNMTAFGNEKNPGPFKNPWRFSSKREEEGLVFFGLRVYDVSLCRWMTPDPMGSVDGPNLYVYVGNSPLNRLDLFGLQADEIEKQLAIIEVSANAIAQQAAGQFEFLRGKFIMNGVVTNCWIGSDCWRLLEFSPEETQVGKVNLYNHFCELMPNTGSCIGLITLQGGVNTSKSDILEMSKQVSRSVPENTLFIGVYNSFSNIIVDLFRAFLERRDIQTPTVRRTAQLFGAIAQGLNKINPEMTWLHISHSEGGVICRRAIEMLPSEEKEILKQQFLGLAVGPAMLVPSDYGLDVKNIYSHKDYVTKWFAREQNDGFSYNVEFLKCVSSRKERTLWFADHAFMGKTYQNEIKNVIKVHRQNRGFFSDDKRK